MKIVALILGVMLVIGSMGYFLYLRNAHSSFENYYAFRGCRKLIEKQENYGVCQLANGKKIVLVEYKNKWYLQGDLPGSGL